MIPKFRIYDKKRKEWVHDTEHAVSLLGETILMGEILRRPDDTFVSLGDIEHLDVMQDTGLKDKNKKDIFVGDILKSKMGNREIKGVMTFNQERAQYGMESVIQTDKYIPEHIELRSRPEVIGNIYDNPDLIK